MPNKNKYQELVRSFSVSDLAPVDDVISEIVQGQRYLERSACLDDIVPMLEDCENLEEAVLEVKKYFKDVEEY